METFAAVIQDAGGGGAYVEIPATVLTALGGGPRIPVQATFDDVPYQGSIVSMGDCQALGVLKAVRLVTGSWLHLRSGTGSPAP